MYLVFFWFFFSSVLYSIAKDLTVGTIYWVISDTTLYKFIYDTNHMFLAKQIKQWTILIAYFCVE